MNQAHPIQVTGIGYSTPSTCGAVAGQIHLHCAGTRDASRILESRGMIKALPKNWGRFDQVSLTAFASALWACTDAGIPFAEGKRNIGVVGFNPEGSLDSNRLYYDDYMNAGRNSARSNLFVYTLPTTPLSEVSLFCGFTGPLFYLYQFCGGAGRLIEEAEALAANDNVDAMLAIFADSLQAVSFVLQKSKKPGLFHSTHLRDSLKGVITINEIFQSLAVLPKHPADE